MLWLGPSWLTDKAAIRPSAIHGQGVIAQSPISKGELIAVWRGYALSTAERNALSPNLQRYPVRLTADCFLGPCRIDNLETVDYFNHSLNPTCEIFCGLLVLANRDIDPGEELTFDYGDDW